MRSLIPWLPTDDFDKKRVFRDDDPELNPCAKIAAPMSPKRELRRVKES